ncbi:response regulator [bacterium]|nr:response regulator [bacterium]
MKNKRIILFERHKGVQFVLERSLRKFNGEIEILSAKDVDEVKALVDADHADLLITELSKMDSDGLAVSKYARQANPNLKIIWITVLGCNEFKQQKDQLNILDCMEKPLEISEFRADVLEALQ